MRPMSVTDLADSADNCATDVLDLQVVPIALGRTHVLGQQPEQFVRF